MCEGMGRAMGHGDGGLGGRDVKYTVGMKQGGTIGRKKRVQTGAVMVDSCLDIGKEEV